MRKQYVHHIEPTEPEAPAIFEIRMDRMYHLMRSLKGVTEDWHEDEGVEYVFDGPDDWGDDGAFDWMDFDWMVGHDTVHIELIGGIRGIIIRLLNVIRFSGTPSRM